MVADLYMPRSPGYNQYEKISIFYYIFYVAVCSILAAITWANKLNSPNRVIAMPNEAYEERKREAERMGKKNTQ